MDIVLEFYHVDEKKLKNSLKETFKGQAWLKAFLNDSHHGFTHGAQVRLACLKLISNLTPSEKRKLLQEGKEICKINSYEYAVTAIELAAIFHDCGRFNEDGGVVAGEQKYHQILSAKRAKIFCDYVGLSIVASDIEEAILCHDFQSKELTPNLNPPKTIIGKIVQSSDQMGWFHPNSINRTLDFNKALGAPFYDSRVTLEERLLWKPTIKAGDALTVMLSQLFGPINNERFGIEFAKNKVEKYKIDLENSIIKIAKKYNLKSEVETLIKAFREYPPNQ